MRIETNSTKWHSRHIRNQSTLIRVAQVHSITRWLLSMDYCKFHQSHKPSVTLDTFFIFRVDWEMKNLWTNATIPRNIRTRRTIGWTSQTLFAIDKRRACCLACRILIFTIKSLIATTFRRRIDREIQYQYKYCCWNHGCRSQPLLINFALSILRLCCQHRLQIHSSNNVSRIYSCRE